MLRDLGLKVARPDRTFATVDHIVPTDGAARPFQDPLAEGMIVALEQACREFGIRLFDAASGRQGIVHVIGPELGLTQPGMVIACGDSHTATHGAFGAIAFGIGTTQVRDVLATQTLSLAPLKVRRVEVRGRLRPGVYAKDLVLHIIRLLGVDGGTGYAYEYAGEAVAALEMEERMTLCNMAIEGGARVGYVNPDQKTFDYLARPPVRAEGRRLGRGRRAGGSSIASDADASYDDVVRIDAADVAPTVTWGVNPGQAIGVTERVPRVEDGKTEAERASIQEALEYMQLEAGAKIEGVESTWPSSAVARTDGSRTFGRSRATSRAGRWRRACGRSPSPARRRSRGWPRRKGSTACSARRASSGAGPAARCASP